MDLRLQEDLSWCETDIEGAMNRFGNDEALYIRCLAGFLEDRTMGELAQALAAEAWDEAFTAAHALKGLAGNMGFVPLFHASAELVILIREGRLSDIRSSYKELERCYRRVTRAIRGHCEVKQKGDCI